MAEIRRYPLFSHLRAESNVHVFRHRNGALVQEGRGLAFWFRPLSHSVAEVPMDDQNFAFVAHTRSRDHQEVSVQGAVTWRIGAPKRAAERLDFTLDLATGRPRQTPIEQIETLVASLAEQSVQRVVSRHTVHELLGEALEPSQAAIVAALVEHEALSGLGVTVAGVRVGDIRPAPEVEKALQTPTRERIQQAADEATFARRALAVEKERAIAENELQNRIELARRESELIDQRGQNARREATESAEAARIAAEAEAERKRLMATTEAARIQAVAQARAEGEKARVAAYEDVPPAVLYALAAKEFAGKLKSIEHLNLSPDMFGPLMANLMQAGTKRLEG